MSRTRVKIKPFIYGDFKRQRLDHAPEGIELPLTNNQPSYVNLPIRSENAPQHAPATILEKNLKPHEIKKITEYVAGFLIREGKIRIVDLSSSGGMPKGKRAPGDFSPLTDDEMVLSGRHKMISSKISHRVKCGLELVANMYIGRTQTTLLELGQILARDTHKKAAEGALTDFFANAAYEIELAERYFEIENRNRGIRRNSRFPKERLAF